MKQQRDHNHVPQFLLSQWRKPNGKLTVYMRATGIVVACEQHLSNMVFNCDRYSHLKVARGRQQTPEFDFPTRCCGSPAAPIVQKLLDGDHGPLTLNERLDLTRFILSLWLRSPGTGALAKAKPGQLLKAQFARDPEEHPGTGATASLPALIEWIGQKTNAPTLEFGKSLFSNIVVDDAVGMRILNLPWYTYDARHSNIDFVIGDRPCLVEGNSISGDFTIALPLSPKVMFLICSQPVRIEVLRRARMNDVVNEFNRASVIYASQHVYATGNHHMPLVAQLLSGRLRTSRLIKVG